MHYYIVLIICFFIGSTGCEPPEGYHVCSGCRSTPVLCTDSGGHRSACCVLRHQCCSPRSTDWGQLRRQCFHWPKQHICQTMFFKCNIFWQSIRVWVRICCLLPEYSSVLDYKTSQSYQTTEETSHLGQISFAFPLSNTYLLLLSQQQPMQHQERPIISLENCF